jgi:VanZ family protein
MRKILSIILVIVWMALIFSFSNENGNKSSSLSVNIITNVVTNFTNVKKGSKEMNKIVTTVSLPVRKCAHFFLYFVLAFLVMNSLYIFKVDKYILIYAGLICILFSISDEVHQLFIVGRSGNIKDVLLDSSASLISSYLFYKFIILRHNS